MKAWLSTLAADIRGATKRLPPCCQEDKFTYVISGGALMKIGRTIDLEQRLLDLQHSSPVQLRLEALGRGDVENRLHQRFKRHRRHGEWFARRAVWRFLKKRPSRLCVSCFDEWSDHDFAAIVRCGEIRPDRPNEEWPAFNDLADRFGGRVAVCEMVAGSLPNQYLHPIAPLAVR